MHITTVEKGAPLNMLKSQKAGLPIYSKAVDNYDLVFSPLKDYDIVPLFNEGISIDLPIQFPNYVSSAPPISNFMPDVARIQNEINPNNFLDISFETYSLDGINFLQRMPKSNNGFGLPVNNLYSLKPINPKNLNEAYYFNIMSGNSNSSILKPTNAKVIVDKTTVLDAFKNPRWKANGEICAKAIKTDPNTTLMGFYSIPTNYSGGFSTSKNFGPIDVDKDGGFCLDSNSFKDNTQITFKFAQMDKNANLSQFISTNPQILSGNLAPVITAANDFKRSTYVGGGTSNDFVCTQSLADCIFPALKIPTTVDPEGDNMYSTTTLYQNAWGNISSPLQIHSGNNVKISNNSLTQGDYVLVNTISDIYGATSRNSYYKIVIK